MRDRMNIHSPDGRLPSGGLPFHRKDGLRLPRGDLQSLADPYRCVSCCERDEARAGPTHYNTGPPDWRFHLPMKNVGCRGSTPPTISERHPERSRFLTSEGSDQNARSHPDAVPTAERSDQHGISQILRADELGRRMTHGLGWSPPSRNDPAGSSTPKKKYGHPERSRFETSEGCDQREFAQWAGVTKQQCADEKECSVVELSEETKFSRIESSGTPSFSLIADRTEEMSTMNALS